MVINIYYYFKKKKIFNIIMKIIAYFKIIIKYFIYRNDYFILYYIAAY